MGARLKLVALHNCPMPDGAIASGGELQIVMHFPCGLGCALQRLGRIVPAPVIAVAGAGVLGLAEIDRDGGIRPVGVSERGLAAFDLVRPRGQT